MGKLSKKLVSIVTAVVVMSGIAFTSLPAIEAKAVTTITASGTETFVNPLDTAIKDQVESYSVTSYGLTDKTKDGVILHAFCWSFNTIKDNMADIAASGYSTVQTSPANNCNDHYPTMKILGNSSNGTDGMWWWHYQPTDWKIGSYQLGTREEFKTMCAEAEKYGVKIIVDVLPNHTTPELGRVSQDLKNAAGGQDALYHANGFTKIENMGGYSNRLACTTGMMGGLPDVNTENKGFQEYYLKYCNDVIACGGDGFRYDTAKHIGVPSDPKDPKASENDFWPVVTGKKSVNNVSLADNGNLFIYGEVLQDTGIPYTEYASYMEMTASGYGGKLRNVIGSKNFSASNLGNWDHATPDKIVTWVESHDTYFNDGESRYLSDWSIKMCWAVLAARKQGTPLYFSRPDGNNNGTNWAGNNVLGAKGDNLFKDPEVVAVNKFRNAMVGQSEYMRNPNGNSQILQIDRGTLGTVIINLGGDTSLNNDTTMANGTYTDQVSGGTFTVSGGKISGQLKAGKVHAIYNPGPVIAQPTVGASQQGGSFKGDSLELTLTTTNSTSSTYSVDGGAAIAYTNGQKVTIGANTPVNGTITVKLSASGAEGTTPASQTYTFTKKDGSVQAGVYFNKPSSWGTPTVYVYDDSVTPAKTNGAWPGVAMTDNGNGEYYYAIPSDFKNAKVIFGSNGVQFPASQQPGHAYTAGTALICDGSTWTEKPIVVSPTISSLTADKVSTQPANTVINFNTVATGGTGALTYQYKVNSVVVQDYSSSATLAWKPSADGDYTIEVNVKDANAKSATKTTTFTIKTDIIIPLTISSFTTVQASPQTLGNAITLNTISGGGTGILQTRFTAFDGSRWIFIKDYSTVASVSWIPTKAGNYTIWADVKDGTGKVVSKSLSYNITVQNTPPTISSFTAGLVSPQTVGKAITLNTISSGGTGTLQTRITAFDGLKWIFIKDYSTVASATWTPTKAGNYTIWADVKDGTGKVVSKSLPYIVTNPTPPTISSFTTGVASPQILGNTITLNTISSGGTGTLQTRFTAFDGSKWIFIKDYSTLTSASWTPTKAGNYTVWADVKDSSGKVVSKPLTYVITLGDPVTITNVTTDKASPQPAGTAIKITAAASSATGLGLTYKFSAFEGLEGWKALGTGFTSSNVATWIPTGTGDCTILVEVRDSLGNRKLQFVNYTVTESVNPTTTVASNNSLISVTGNWTRTTTLSTTTDENASMSFNFTGTEIKINGIKGTNYGTALVLIDGVMEEADFYSTTAGSGQVYLKTGLVAGVTHNITVFSFGIKNMNSTANTIAINSFAITNGNIK